MVNEVTYANTIWSENRKICISIQRHMMFSSQHITVIDSMSLATAKIYSFHRYAKVYRLLSGKICTIPAVIVLYIILSSTLQH